MTEAVAKSSGVNVWAEPLTKHMDRRGNKHGSHSGLTLRRLVLRRVSPVRRPTSTAAAQGHGGRSDGSGGGGGSGTASSSSATAADVPPPRRGQRHAGRAPPAKGVATATCSARQTRASDAQPTGGRHSNRPPNWIKHLINSKLQPTLRKRLPHVGAASYSERAATKL